MNVKAIRKQRREARAELIRKARKERGLTQEQLASKSKIFSLSYLQKIETAASCSEEAYDHFMQLLAR